MAVNKRKILDAARKYVQKGAKQKALKEFERLLKLDPRDGKLRLEIGDSHRRWGQIDEAVAQYSKVADQYKQDGFDARSVAVYKQVLNLDPKRYTAYVSLSELYQRMGLDAEAIGSLQTAADGYHKEGKKREALELLRKMATLDPTNTTSRMKVADLLKQEGLKEESVAEYEAVAEELERQGAIETVAKVYARILEIQPKRVDVLVATARTLISLEQFERAEGFARKAHEAEPDETDHLDVLCDIYKSLGRDDELGEATRSLASIFRERGDDDRAREIMQRLPDGGTFDVEMSEAVSVDDLAPEEEEPALSDDELLDDEFLASDDEAMFGNSDVGIGGDSPLMTADDPEPEAPEELSSPEGDPDQLLAEASVYLRYGKREQAIVSLDAILVVEPNHRSALEKLGEAHAEGSDAPKAVEAWTRAAGLAQAAGDQSAFDILRDRIAALDPDAASALGASAEEPEPSVAEEPEPVAAASDATEEPEADEGIELDLGDDEVSFDEAPSAVDEETDVEPDDGGIEFELDLDDDEPEEEPESVPSEAEAALDPDLDIELDVAADAVAADEGPAGSVGGASLSATTSSQINEDLEEAEFYFQQGLYDEAEGIYQRVLALAPSHPSATLRMGEIEAARGGDGGAIPAEDDAGAAGIEIDLDVSDVDVADAEGRIELDLSSGEAEDSEESDETDPAAIDIDIDMDTDVDVADALEAAVRAVSDDEGDADAGADDDTDDTLEAPADDATESVSADEVYDERENAFDEHDSLSTPTLESVEPAPVEAPQVARPRAEDTQPLGATGPGVTQDPFEDTGSGATFDLAAELREAFDDEDANPNEQSGVLSTVEDGFASIFSEFKKGVSQTLTEGDTETRYDLGIAYREMGLLEDAIAEFRVCMTMPGRMLECLTMMGMCALELGRHADAVSHFEQALAGEELPDDARTGLSFDLGRAFEMAGDTARARAAFETVIELAPNYQDVQERLAGLGETAAAPEALESFDDLTAEIEAMDEAEEEAFESFDDFLTEAEAALDEDDVPDADEVEAEVESEPEAEPDASGESSGGRGRKKKISFV